MAARLMESVRPKQNLSAFMFAPETCVRASSNKLRGRRLRRLLLCQQSNCLGTAESPYSCGEVCSSPFPDLQLRVDRRLYCGAGRSPGETFYERRGRLPGEDRFAGRE